MADSSQWSFQLSTFLFHHSSHSHLTNIARTPVPRWWQVYYSCLKLRFHLCAMRMRMKNANATQNGTHRISTGVIPFIRMWKRTANATKWIAACGDQSECECFIGRKIRSYTGLPQSSTCLTQENYTVTGSLIAFIIGIRRSYSHYAQMKS